MSSILLLDCIILSCNASSSMHTDHYHLCFRHGSHFANVAQQ